VVESLIILSIAGVPESAAGENPADYEMIPYKDAVTKLSELTLPFKVSSLPGQASAG
jgi:hypothetical protein